MNYEQMSREVVNVVIRDLSKRKGVGNELEEIADQSPEVYREMLDTLRQKVLRLLTDDGRVWERDGSAGQC